MNTPIVENSLNQTASKLTELYNNKNCKEFVNTFPNNFQEFNQLYGYDDEKGSGQLYSKPKYINYFFDCTEVPAFEKLKKSISIGIDGKWDADLIGMFQFRTFILVKDHSNETKDILNNLSDERAATFWYFLFDSPHPSDKEIVKRVDSMNNLMGKNSKQSKLLTEQHQKIRIDWKEH
ncbi:MAG: hypothetical protein WKF92_06770 [Pyrinomonadaceae bacterium]